MNENTPVSSELPESPAVEPVAEPVVEPAAEPITAEAEASAPAVAEPTPADIGAQLKAQFPALFTGGYKPLKLRIQADIQERAPGQFTKTQLSAFFRRFTGSTGYLIALSKAKMRFDLDGQEAGELSDEHRNAAKEELTRRKGLQQERVNAEREQEQLLNQQRYNRAGLLHDFERTTLTLANFCVLKGTTPEELPALLDLARKERAEAPPREERMQRPQQRPDQQRPRRDNERSTSAPRGARRNASR